ncbi:MULTISPECIES: restriction endonuclease subunit S [Pseudoxanthomonas]|uniref:Type I restriction enzyme S subunit n=1 Tax=Pseudoxanthomonas winnipegensis TaxID=2480810 RepID=A0AAW8GCA7_9GAMM|nr:MULTISPECIES: restriction endonuclease subunit S [Pseudoxanthomonas]MDQ1118684.1 type I restriction enzyme S subunit [Pseudoxanthomonas winnipegensis]MDQ1131869.1 type I restriction enzyme S subunit [Pseudoxanthomonas winnipegensis]MDR6138112.1 type I restriction enzyme S subunit [Pseudoxanthomonas sp. SORGH_AS_0997]
MTALLTDNLPLLAGAPNGIKKLRELILELAVRGKLVPQDPSDEPASKLLKRIAEEKARLVVEGKIKKQKPLADINADGVPFEIPVTWEWARLGEITNFGITIKKKEIPEDAWVLDLEDIEKDTSKLLQKACLKERNSLSDKNSFTKGDVLYGKLRPYLNKVLVADEDGFCTTEILPFRCYGPFVADYFMVALKSPYFLSYVNARSYGMKMPRLGTEDGRQAFFPLPPLAEQHRIVAKVDELMALCDRLEARQADADSAHAKLVQALLGGLTQGSDVEDFEQSWQRLAEHFHTLFTTESSIDALKQALLQLAVMGKLVQQDPSDKPASALVHRIHAEKQRYLAESKARKQKDFATESRPEPPFEVPDGWEWQTIDDVLHVTGGVTLGRQLAGRKLVSKPYLRVANVQRGRLTMDHIKEVEVPEDEVEKYLLQRGDLLITEGGDWDKVGRTATWRDELPECLHQNHVFRARAVTADWEPRWAEMYLNSASAREYFAGSSKQTTNLASINMTQLRACAFPLPPLAEQHRIVAKVDQLMALCDQLKARLGEIRQVHGSLANALIGQALNGEESGAGVVDFSAYLISKLAPQRTFGRVAHMKLIFLADSHLGLGLMDGYRRHAAGPLDTSIYRVEERAAQEGLYTTSVEVLKSGQEKVTYHIGVNIGRSVEMAAVTLGAGQKELDRLIALFEGRKTDDLEAVATLYAVWNDALAEGFHPNDEWLINEFRGNWHEAKERFTPDILGKWLGWMRDHGLVPTGNSAVTKSQAAFLFK